MEYSPGMWWYEVANTYSASPGRYPLRFTAYDQAVGDVISKEIDVYVTIDTFPPQWDGVMHGLDEAIPGDPAQP